VASGKEVTIHEAPISAHGFTGSGYFAIDPQTGAGAYIIEGGARGAYWRGVGFGQTLALELFLLGASFIAGPGAAALLLGLLPSFLYIGYQMTIYVKSLSQDERSCFFNGVSQGFAASSMALGLVPGLGLIGPVLGTLGGLFGLALGEYINDTPGYLCRNPK
jgi:hypothetical protein